MGLWEREDFQERLDSGSVGVSRWQTATDASSFVIRRIYSIDVAGGKS